jgi:hypothetical protein
MEVAWMRAVQRTSRRRWLGRVTALASALFLVIGLSAGPAAAQTAYYSDGAASGWGSWTWVDHDTLGSIKLNVRDTACNAQPATIWITVYREYGYTNGSSRTNYNGCHGSDQTWSLGTISYDTDVINIQFCIEGASRPRTCGSYLDNPHT